MGCKLGQFVRCRREGGQVAQALLTGWSRSHCQNINSLTVGLSLSNSTVPCATNVATMYRYNGGSLALKEDRGTENSIIFSSHSYQQLLALQRGASSRSQPGLRVRNTLTWLGYEIRNKTSIPANTFSKSEEAVSYDASLV
ncbi:hypothetical protein QBC36DRAFT_314728 [Triangularia setosa]|uniref:Uncharacterized protein n=1 Tax=Triangularia setosa TaxID=2587417 RepID=A0AAN6VZ98_9PEZI|nr:hypothetical protein QBC36DRAFT_314728 [Podospora setosa]